MIEGIEYSHYIYRTDFKSNGWREESVARKGQQSVRVANYTRSIKPFTEVILFPDDFNSSSFFLELHFHIMREERTK